MQSSEHSREFLFFGALFFEHHFRRSYGLLDISPLPFGIKQSSKPSFSAMPWYQVDHPPRPLSHCEVALSMQHTPKHIVSSLYSVTSSADVFRPRGNSKCVPVATIWDMIHLLASLHELNVAVCLYLLWAVSCWSKTTGRLEGSQLATHYERCSASLQSRTPSSPL
jgi:hypothetical protein